MQWILLCWVLQTGHFLRLSHRGEQWIYSHHNTDHKHVNACSCNTAIVDKAVDSCNTKTPSRTLMWIMYISNRSCIIPVWEYHTVAITVLKRGIRVAFWLWKVFHNIKVTFDSYKNQSPSTSRLPVELNFYLLILCQQLTVGHSE